MRLRNIPRNVPRYTRRALSYRLNSSPFISGDLFADNADVQVYGPRFRSLQPSRKSVSNAQVIFCPSHELERFLEEYGGAIHAHVLILGNSDRDFPSFDYKIPPSIRAIFAQNLHFQDDRLRILPIGVENLRLATNGMHHLFSNSIVKIPKNRNLLVGPLSPTHAERDLFYTLENSTSDGITVLNTRIQPTQYAHFSAQYKYVVAPRGNGLDTHRFWETLYRGSIPIVLRSKWAENLQGLGLPHRQVDEWSRRSILNATHEHFSQFDPKTISALWWEYWRLEIKKYL